MKVSAVQARQLPCFRTAVIPPDYLDEMGHMNIRWYMALFDEAAWGLFGRFGLDAEYARTQQGGAFALTHHVRYLAEVHVGQQVSVHSRLLARSARRIQFMHFMVNDTTNVVAATLEVLGAHADLRARRMAPFPAAMAEAIDALIVGQAALVWPAPTCGVINV